MEEELLEVIITGFVVILALFIGYMLGRVRDASEQLCNKADNLEKRVDELRKRVERLCDQEWERIMHGGDC